HFRFGGGFTTRRLRRVVACAIAATGQGEGPRSVRHPARDGSLGCGARAARGRGLKAPLFAGACHVSHAPIVGVWRSPVARKFWVLQAAGSNPATPTRVTGLDGFTRGYDRKDLFSRAQRDAIGTSSQRQMDS